MTREMTPEDKEILISIARQAIQCHLERKELPLKALDEYSPLLQTPGACFVTLTKNGVLRGCVGSIETTQALVYDVRDRAVGAAFLDYRFPAVSESELDEIRIEISRLTSPQPLDYQSPEDLINKLQPGRDGVILKFGSRRATFLPQVWNQLQKPELFLDRLCLKLGLESSAWRTHNLAVEIYQAEKIEEGPLDS